jgi:stage II sporulation protein D (peptidoglycan lytic transglycosylase)
MSVSRLAVAVGAGIAAACLATPIAPTLPERDALLPESIRVRFVEGGAMVVRDVPLEDYVRATSLSEFAPAAGDPAAVEQMLEVQAIISRTYAVAHIGRHAREGFDLCSTTHCQLFDPARLRTSRWTAAAIEAVDRTRGLVLRFAGHPAQAIFHADCGGRTSRSASVWGGENRDYLVSRADEDEDAPDTVHVRWEYRARAEAIAEALIAFDATRFDGSLTSIDVAVRDEAGRAQKIAIISTGATVPLLVRGEDFRLALSRAFGARSIRSTRFDVRRDGGWYAFAGQGFGHGVGLCQAGAAARLRAGATPQDVLRFYYPGTALR